MSGAPRAAIYLRVRAALATLLWHVGREDEAMQHLLALLRLDESDLLLVILLFRAEVERVDGLLARFPDDRSAMWLYDGALHHFRKGREAQELPRVSPYLLERRAIPRRAASGTAYEDIVCAIELTELWASIPGAREWLGEAAGRGRRGKA